MKVNGKTPNANGPRESVVVIPIGDETYTFRARMVDANKFEEVSPQPQPPEAITDGKPFKDFEDKGYLDEITKWATWKTDWWMLESLKATEDLEWDTVDVTNPETFGNWRTELEKAQFSDAEIAAIINMISDANGMSSERLDEATNTFLAQEAERLATTA